jgi:hypothetical protein
MKHYSKYFFKRLELIEKRIINKIDNKQYNEDVFIFILIMFKKLCYIINFKCW